MADERPALDAGLLAQVYMKVRGAHGPNGNVEDSGEPCQWCRQAAEQHIEAAASYERLSRERAREGT